MTCAEAAEARGVPLTNELKSLLLETTYGPVVVHVPGDKRVSLRAAKMSLHCRQVSLASPMVLEKLGLSPGTVCPFYEPLWSMRQLVCRELLARRPLTTNNGTLRGYFVFEPELLLTAPFVMIGRFSDEPRLRKPQ